MRIALMDGVVSLTVLAVVFPLTSARRARRRSLLSSVGRSGLLAVLLALGVALVGAGLAFALAELLLAPVMLIAGSVLLVLPPSPRSRAA